MALKSTLYSPKCSTSYANIPWCAHLSSTQWSRPILMPIFSCSGQQKEISETQRIAEEQKSKKMASTANESTTSHKTETDKDGTKTTTTTTTSTKKNAGKCGGLIGVLVSKHCNYCKLYPMKYAHIRILLCFVVVMLWSSFPTFFRTNSQLSASEATLRNTGTNITHKSKTKGSDQHKYNKIMYIF